MPPQATRGRLPCYKASSLTRAPSSPQVLTAASGVQLHAVCIGSISVIERQHGAAPMSERRPSEGPSDEESYSCNGELERPPRCFRHGARRASHTFRCTAFRRPHTYLPYLYRVWDGFRRCPPIRGVGSGPHPAVQTRDALECSTRKRAPENRVTRKRRGEGKAGAQRQPYHRAPPSVRPLKALSRSKVQRAASSVAQAARGGRYNSCWRRETVSVWVRLSVSIVFPFLCVSCVLRWRACLLACRRATPPRAPTFTLAARLNHEGPACSGALCITVAPRPRDSSCDR